MPYASQIVLATLAESPHPRYAEHGWKSQEKVMATS